MNRRRSRRMHSHGDADPRGTRVERLRPIRGRSGRRLRSRDASRRSFRCADGLDGFPRLVFPSVAKQGEHDPAELARDGGEGDVVVLPPGDEGVVVVAEVGVVPPGSLAKRR